MAGAGLIMPFWWSADDANLCNSDDHQTMPTYAILIMMTPELPCLLLSIVPRQLFWIWSNIHHEELEVFYWIEGSHQILFPPLSCVRLHIRGSDDLWSWFRLWLDDICHRPGPALCAWFQPLSMIAKGLEDSSIPLEMLVTTQNSKELHLCLNQQQGGADPPSSESSTPREREREEGERPICNISLFISATSATRWSSRHCNPKGLLN